MPGECRGRQGNAGEGREIQGNAGECQRNIWEWVYSVRVMQGTTREM